jgi:predicted RNase H-like nuclease (RuvC/YqgF family)
MVINVWKKYIICGIIFIFEFIFICTVGYSFFSKGNERHKQLLEQRDSTINELRNTLEDSETEIKQLREELSRSEDIREKLSKLNSQSGIEVDDSLGIVRQLKDNQSELRKRLSKTGK